MVNLDPGIFCFSAFYLFNVPILQKVPKQRVSLLTNAVKFVMCQKSRAFTLLSDCQTWRNSCQPLLLTERCHCGKLLLLLDRLSKLKHVLVVRVLVFEVVQVFVRLVGQSGTNTLTVSKSFEKQQATLILFMLTL